jgi:hypothetical protein
MLSGPTNGALNLANTRNDLLRKEDDKAMSVRLAGMAANCDESHQIRHCKTLLRNGLQRASKRHGPPITVAALAELTAEMSCDVAGPDLTIYMLLEFAKQIAAQCPDRQELEEGLDAASFEAKNAGFGSARPGDAPDRT